MPETFANEEQVVIRLGVSACLMGEMVRFDGGHKKDRFLVQTLGQFVQWVPVCPEVEIGLGTPRESLRLEGDLASPRLVAPKSGSDHTEKMQLWARQRLVQLAALDLHGYVLKKSSPSCGLHRVRVYQENGIPINEGRGIFAHELVNELPLLPVEEEGRLHDPKLRENFVQRIFAYYRWTRMLMQDSSPASLVRFHTSYKLTLMAHSNRHYREMGRLVAEAGNQDWQAMTRNYGHMLMEGLKILSSPGKHTNVLQHLMGFLKDHLTSADKADLISVIEDYRRGYVPLVVPLTLIRHHLRRSPTPDWVHQQVYLNPYPKELALQNHV